MSSLLHDRAVSLVQSSFLGDFSAMPLHWIYNQQELENKVGSNDPLFFETPSCPFYKYPSGVLSPYGDESLPVLRSVSSQGGFNRDHTAETMYDFFRVYHEEGSKGYVGRLNHAPKSFVAARATGADWDKCGQDDSQANGIAKVPIIVARYAGDTSLPKHIEALVRIIQDSDLSVVSSLLVGKVLEKILLTGRPPKEVLYDILSDPSSTPYEKKLLHFVSSKQAIAQWVHLSQAIDAKPAPTDDAYRAGRVKGKLLSHYLSHSASSSISLEEAVETVDLALEDKAFLQDSFRESQQTFGLSNLTVSPISFSVVASAIGLSCLLPQALLNVLYIWLHAVSLKEALTLNVLAGGDSCSRALVLGAAYGAYDPSAVQWIDKVNPELWSEITSAAQKIASDNPALQN